MCGTRQKYGIQYLWSYLLTTVALCTYILVTGLGHTRQLLKKFDMQASDCSLTNSKSAKRRTKLAVLIITHLSSTTNVTCILDDPVPVLHTS